MAANIAHALSDSARASLVFISPAVRRSSMTK
jgi:hypothetical protein